ncbi:GGDEF domain-containing protein [Saccharospirillum sp. HFRX-1]|uniref:GGDEF domain-containing protein n=1 Tax=unclassified Saccharospirillum TaxID=2633430 RepID=UPI00371D6B19
MKAWPMAVPSDAQLQELATRIMLWALLLIYLLYAILLRLTDTNPTAALFPLVCAGLHLFGIVGFYFGKTLFASVWMTLVVLLDITIINIYGFTESQGAEYYFIMIPALIFMVLPPQQREWQISLLTLTLALLSLCFMLPEPSEPWFIISDQQIHNFKWLDLVVCLLCMAVTCRFFIHRLLQQRAQLERLALIDTLTGLPNRHGLMQQLAGWFNEGRPFSVFLLDIEDYPELSRRLGQDAGDQLIRKLVQRLRTETTDNLFIGRFTEHQLMLASDVATQPKAVSEMAQQIYDSSVRLAFDLGGHSERVQVSVGATLASANEPPHSLLQRLTSALQQARALTPRVHLILAEPAKATTEIAANPNVQLAPPY